MHEQERWGGEAAADFPVARPYSVEAEGLLVLAQVGVRELVKALSDRPEILRLTGVGESVFGQITPISAVFRQQDSLAA